MIIISIIRESKVKLSKNGTKVDSPLRATIPVYIRTLLELHDQDYLIFRSVIENDEIKVYIEKE